ncbi:PREDICTED: mitogen-activated protein kinase kinase kinase 1-like isoform X1 [Nelumbo nucifera]|uniref:mitogen-activated protein kinase kinase kinase n=1 Tax=Nelumbo nucifera TaxID=4432 RepID=A0A1U7Z339_NELNU|nr:PREDICTED: mitogen-activated protein kinase kinase kinase 1-like isoform X1 [Nelumbo nucifera]
MHRLPRLFGSRSKKDEESMDRNPSRQKPKLERRNAVKNIDYDPFGSSSSPPGDLSPTLRASRSLDVGSISNKTSFRVEGAEEINELCRSLGLSGPDDFAIPTAAWEARKARCSSDVLPRSRLSKFVVDVNERPVEPADEEEKEREDGSWLRPPDRLRASDEDADRSTGDRSFRSVRSEPPPEVEEEEREDGRSIRVSARVRASNEAVDRSRKGRSVRSVRSVPPEIQEEEREDDLSARFRARVRVNNEAVDRSMQDSSVPPPAVAGEEREDGSPIRLSTRVKVSDEALHRSTEDRSISAPLFNSRHSVPLGSHGSPGGGGVGGGGIKGVRPPVLAPPPAMSQKVDHMKSASTWDIFNSFAPDDRGPSLSSLVETSSSDEEKDDATSEEDDEGVVTVDAKLVEHVKRLSDTTGLSESCSFTTSNDDDSSSTTTDPTSNNISPALRTRRTIMSWQRGELLGSGSFGTVYEGIADDGFFIAVKEILLDQGNQGNQSLYQLEQEVALLSQFEHENIVQYYGTTKDDTKLYIFLELVTQGSLAKLYQKYCLGDSQVSAYTRQILNGLKYLHGQNVIHRDIKCANILVDANGSVKLADFGLAKSTKLNDVKSCKGTAFWMAPEVVKSSGYGLPADIWSLGCTVLEMLTGQLPYSSLEWMQALFRIGRGILPPVPDSLSPDARDFIFRCLQVNPNHRPTASELLEHQFVKRPLLASSIPPSPLHPSARRP